MSATATRRHALPRRGRWLFLATLLLFWALLALSGMERFKRPEPTVIAYAIPAPALEGVTGLRLEEGGGNAQRLAVRVVLDEAPEVRITLRARRGEGEDPDTLPAQFPELTARREADMLVLRWTEVPAVAGVPPRRHGKSTVWMDEIVLPAQFRHLALARARIEARTPVERLEVVGQAIAVRGAIGRLDLWSTQCRPCASGTTPALAEDVAQCAERTRRGTAALEVNAARMRSLRVDTRAGQLDLSETQGLDRALLQLGDSVALSVDRASVLEKARGNDRGEPLGMPPACGGPATDPAPVQLLPANPPQAEGASGP